MLPDAGVHAAVRRLTTSLVDQLGATSVVIPGQQALRLPHTHVQHTRGRLRRPPGRPAPQSELRSVAGLACSSVPSPIRRLTVPLSRDLRRHFGFAELRHYCFAPIHPVGAHYN